MLARQNPYQQSFQKRKKGGSEKKKRDDGPLSSKSRGGVPNFSLDEGNSSCEYEVVIGNEQPATPTPAPAMLKPYCHLMPPKS